MELRNVSANGHSEADISVPSFSIDAPYDTNMFFVNADQTVTAWGSLKDKATKYNVAIWTWELEDFPKLWDAAFQNYDEIWAPSSFSQSAIAVRSPIPVVRVPYCVNPMKDSGKTRADFGIGPQRFVFLAVFDMRSGFERKNPIGAIRAFRQVFGEDHEVELIVKVNHADSAPRALSQLRQEASANVRLIDTALRYEDVTALIRCSDCVVSLHRSEGFGLVLAEAMWLGKPVITTAYSGDLDFTTLDNAFLVSFDMQLVGPGNMPYLENAVWANPHIDHAAQQMKLVYENTGLRLQRAIAGQSLVRSKFSAESIGAVMATRLDLFASGLSRMPRS